MAIITIDILTFRKKFPYFTEEIASDDQILGSYSNTVGIVALETGTINTDLATQTQMVYLATAHLLFLALNPSVGNGMVNSASQGDESLGYQQRPVKNWFDYYLGLTPYGLQLLMIMQQIQPPIPQKPTNPYPYYTA